MLNLVDINKISFFSVIKEKTVEKINCNWIHSECFQCHRVKVVT